MLSFTGIITYPNNEELREIVKATPLDRIMLETDSPFLTPEAHRGQKNEPAFLVEVAKTEVSTGSGGADCVVTVTAGSETAVSIPRTARTR